MRASGLIANPVGTWTQTYPPNGSPPLPPRLAGCSRVRKAWQMFWRFTMYAGPPARRSQIGTIKPSLTSGEMPGRVLNQWSFASYHGMRLTSTIPLSQRVRGHSLARGARAAQGVITSTAGGSRPPLRGGDCYPYWASLRSQSRGRRGPWGPRIGHSKSTHRIPRTAPPIPGSMA